MQKTTLFTIFFSVVAVTLLAEFLVNKELISGWTSVIPPSSFVADDDVEKLRDDETDEVSGVLKSVAPDTASGTSGAPKEPAPSVPSSNDEVAEFLSRSGYFLESIGTAELLSAGFDRMRMERVSGEGLVFQLLDSSDTTNLSKIRFHLTDGKNVYGVMSEFLLADEARARAFYATLRQKASVYEPTVKANETNSFGAASFYLNDDKRMGTAFLTILSGNRVFALAYPKASHEYYKKLIGLLVR